MGIYTYLGLNSEFADIEVRDRLSQPVKGPPVRRSRQNGLAHLAGS